MLEKAMEFEPNDFYAKSMYVKTCCMLGKYDEVKNILNELGIVKMKDRELAACSKFLLSNDFVMTDLCYLGSSML